MLPARKSEAQAALFKCRSAEVGNPGKSTKSKDADVAIAWKSPCKTVRPPQRQMWRAAERCAVFCAQNVNTSTYTNRGKYACSFLVDFSEKMETAKFFVKKCRPRIFVGKNGDRENGTHVPRNKRSFFPQHFAH
jgi:hypothetical protein